MPITHIGEAEFEEFITSNKLAVIDFSATWCGPCKMLGAALEQILEEDLPDLTIGKVDIDESKSLAETFQIEGVPTLMFFLNGKRVCFQSEDGDMDRIVGAVPKEPLADLLKNLAEEAAKGDGAEDAGEATENE
jgi:thioredoxin 1